MSEFFYRPLQFSEQFFQLISCYFSPNYQHLRLKALLNNAKNRCLFR